MNAPQSEDQQLAARTAGALFYILPKDLTERDVDPLLWPVVESINRSEWVWTAESCQGHPDDAEGLPWSFNTKPMLRLVVRLKDLGTMLAVLACAAPEPADPLHTNVFEVVSHPLKDRWFSVVIYVQAINVYQRNRGVAMLKRFADRLRSPLV